jgi:hypothetical protein
MSQQNDEVSKLAGHLWKPVQALRARARRERQKALDADQAQNGHKMASKSAELPTSANNGQIAPNNSNGNGNADGMVDLDFSVDRLYPNPQQFTPTTNMDTTGGLNSNILWTQSFPTSQPTVSMNMGPSVLTNMSPIQRTSMDGFISPTTVPGWTANDPSFNFYESTMNMGDDTTNWTAWEDMVQQLAMQDEMVQDGPNMGLFDPGMNLF